MESFVRTNSPTTAPKNRQMAMMETARAAASFDSYELACFIHRGEDEVKKRRAAWHRVESITNVLDTSKLPRSYGNMDREQAYDEGLEWGKAAFEDGINYKHNYFDNITPRYVLSNASPFGLTTVMFLPTLRYQGTPEQKAYWIPLAESGQINGAYCQTELGHGTFVRGIETTATLDFDTDEFVIHSPTLSSTKFWPGAIGFSCTHAVVVARLIIRDKDYGTHLFMVQFRSLEDGTPMPGIELGDCGLKMSYNGTCNGYATFNQVRIPRTDMLMGNSAVSKDGKYSKTGHEKIGYATLVYVRTVIVLAVGYQLAQAVTIATRYSIVREQGLGPNGLASAETSLMTYKSQHYRILTLIAKAYAILLASWTCDAEYKELLRMQAMGDHSALPFNHHLSSGFKAWATQTGADGAEDARKCCGGQGYLLTSGLPEIVAAATATASFEGENYVLWQQVGRYLFKCIDALKAGKPIDSQMAYLTSEFVRIMSPPCQARGDQFLDVPVQLAIYRHRALRLVFSTYKELKTSNLPPIDAWNQHMMNIIAAARAHTEFLVLQAFVSHTEPLPAGPVKTVLVRLRSLFALSAITNPYSVNAITFIEDGHLSLLQLNTIRELINDLLAQLKDEAVGLTDAWDFTDASLCSALGMKDGNVYETLMNWTRQIPINVHASQTKGVYEKGWREWMDPVLKAKL
ncbi:acyl-coenzyme A oxidase 1 [Lepidopterella palustris CBS 459.81]|uniref:Acyl-coenzyme A oxidase n=1 Tax=Lepidopterella palustris CBS 459.81 TaxID=1314670 RepID=A0A8E2E0J8_9PEZI|nr:acyl-coenzyme A oxidase 1 [Lepidopterella palustris CBS 459.81]